MLTSMYLVEFSKCSSWDPFIASFNFENDWRFIRIRSELRERRCVFPDRKLLDFECCLNIVIQSFSIDFHFTRVTHVTIVLEFQRRKPLLLFDSVGEIFGAQCFRNWTSVVLIRLRDVQAFAERCPCFDLLFAPSSSLRVISIYPDPIYGFHLLWLYDLYFGLTVFIVFESPDAILFAVNISRPSFHYDKSTCNV